MSKPEEPILKFQIEACVDSLSAAIAAEKWGATRLELCSDLHLDGLTPSPDLAGHVLNSVTIPVKVMIRPRSGNFCYSADELKVMKNSILLMKDIGIKHFVTGLLNPDFKIDISSLSQLLDLAPDCHFTFHKAIDLVTDQVEALELLSPFSEVKAILTSGGCPTALDGSDTIRKLISLYNKRFEIIAAGKITGENFMEVHRLLEAYSYHGRSIVPMNDTSFMNE